MAREIIKIIRVRDMGKYTLTDALMDDGTEAQAYLPAGSPPFQPKEPVEVFFHDRFNKVKFRRTPK